MTAMTKRKALEQCLLIWEYLSKNPHEGPSDKPRVVKDILGYMPTNACPACEYAGQENAEADEPNCNNCPMDEWDVEHPCFEVREGEYWLWRVMSTPNGRQPWAEAIADRTRRSLKNLEDEK